MLPLSAASCCDLLLPFLTWQHMSFSVQVMCSFLWVILWSLRVYALYFLYTPPSLVYILLHFLPFWRVEGIFIDAYLLFSEELYIFSTITCGLLLVQCLLGAVTLSCLHGLWKCWGLAFPEAFPYGHPIALSLLQLF